MGPSYRWFRRLRSCLICFRSQAIVAIFIASEGSLNTWFFAPCPAVPLVALHRGCCRHHEAAWRKKGTSSSSARNRRLSLEELISQITFPSSVRASTTPLKCSSPSRQRSRLWPVSMVDHAMVSALSCPSLVFATALSPNRHRNFCITKNCVNLTSAASVHRRSFCVVLGRITIGSCIKDHAGTPRPPGNERESE